MRQRNIRRKKKYSVFKKNLQFISALFEHRKYLYLFFLLFFFFSLVEYRIKATTLVRGFQPLFIYSSLVFAVLCIRYIGSIFHVTERWKKYIPPEWPSVDIIIPAFNESSSIYETVKSITKCDYATENLNIVLIDDGSKDDTLYHMDRALKDFPSFHIKLIELQNNVGKKEAMAIGIKLTHSKFVIFVDSDSLIERKCIKEIVRPFFKNPRIGAVSGHAMVLNSDVNLLTKMQEIRYFNAFRSVKAFESLLGFVSCCPGCCSAYRRKVLAQILKPWLEQSFLGARCTYGDDRSLTNLILKNGYETVYNEMAVVHTIVPENISQFNKQQIRWKKSWLRENVVVLSFVWKKNPLTAFLMIIDTITPLFTPFVICYILFYLTIQSADHLPSYLIGVVVFASCLGLFYKFHNPKSRKWFVGSLYSSLLSFLLFWHLPYAMIKLRDTTWGTR